MAAWKSFAVILGLLGLVLVAEGKPQGHHTSLLHSFYEIDEDFPFHHQFGVLPQHDHVQQLPERSQAPVEAQQPSVRDSEPQQPLPKQPSARDSSQHHPQHSSQLSHQPHQVAHKSELQHFPQQTSHHAFPPRPTFEQFSQSPRAPVAPSATPAQEVVRSGKHAVVVTNRYGTYAVALNYCRSLPHPSATLFIVETPEDSNWLGRRINYEKDWVTGSSKFWVGLESVAFGRSLRWINGDPYVNYPEVVQVSGYEDSEKIYAWAVPDSGFRLKYEFLTPSDEAEAFICQY